MTGPVEEYVGASAIARWLGFSVDETAEGRLYHLAFNESHIGNPLIRALHGGVIAAFLEFAAQCEILAKLGGAAPVKTVNVDVDYLASSRAKDMTARAEIVRLGRRIAFLEATGWQEREDRPVAKARLRIRISET